MNKVDGGVVERQITLVQVCLRHVRREQCRFTPDRVAGYRRCVHFSLKGHVDVVERKLLLRAPAGCSVTDEYVAAAENDVEILHDHSGQGHRVTGIPKTADSGTTILGEARNGGGARIRDLLLVRCRICVGTHTWRSDAVGSLFGWIRHPHRHPGAVRNQFDRRPGRTGVWEYVVIHHPDHAIAVGVLILTDIVTPVRAASIGTQPNRVIPGRAVKIGIRGLDRAKRVA